MIKALITGGAGYIGSNLADRLLEKGYLVTVLDDLSTGKIENIKHNLGRKEFRFICDTILNEDEVNWLVAKNDVVFHLAAVVGVKYIVENPLRSIMVNIRGTENVFTAAYRHWKKVIIASSSEVYGKNLAAPLKETDDRILGPTAINRWSYSVSKAVDEHLGFTYHQKGLPVVVLRFFNSYGPRVNESGYGTVVANFIRQALRGEAITVHGTGEQTRSFTFVEDTVKGLILAAEIEQAEGEVFNIGNGTETSILELARRVKELTASDSKIFLVPYLDYYGTSYEDTMRRVPSIEKAEKILGFKPTVGLEEGLRRTTEWCRQNWVL